eukprot:TRINITY_DN22782_c0_g1_i1.p1 TRINITY_DN22782_c0_g1~~TRINITY_DN22782_c0_g1_i1.p1  ORF type:complete len:339 (-),score=46.08 TRINITY_DN22782_c0_g1_i1:85-1038(-)
MAAAREQPRAARESDVAGEHSISTFPAAAAQAQALAQRPAERCCRICLDGEEDAAALGRLISPCRCTGTMCFVHERCLERWRISAPSRQSYYRCGACMCEYTLQRNSIGSILLSRSFVHTMTASTFLAVASGVGLTRYWLEREGKRCRCLEWDGQIGVIRDWKQYLGLARRTGLGCPVHRDTYRFCFAAYRFCSLVIAAVRGHRVHRSSLLLQTHADLRKLHFVTVQPLHILKQGMHVLAFGGFGLYMWRHWEERLWWAHRSRWMVIWLLAVASRDFRREAALTGVVMALRELYVALRLIFRRVAQRFGERVVEFRG